MAAGLSRGKRIRLASSVLLSRKTRELFVCKVAARRAQHSKEPTAFFKLCTCKRHFILPGNKLIQEGQNNVAEMG